MTAANKVGSTTIMDPVVTCNIQTMEEQARDLCRMDRNSSRRSFEIINKLVENEEEMHRKSVKEHADSYKGPDSVGMCALKILTQVARIGCEGFFVAASLKYGGSKENEGLKKFYENLHKPISAIVDTASPIVAAGCDTYEQREKISPRIQIQAISDTYKRQIDRFTQDSQKNDSHRKDLLETFRQINADQSQTMRHLISGR